MNKKELFKSNFYLKYTAPNAKQLINVINTYTEIDNSKFKWGKRCDVDKIPLKWKDFLDLLNPSIDLIAKEFNTIINYTMYDPWLSLYKRGQHQEIHEHCGNDISCVFFANSGEGFADFYFSDRNSIFLTERVKKLINYKPIYVPEINAGDILFFPSNMAHGVSPHKSDVIRKTLAVNFTINS